MGKRRGFETGEEPAGQHVDHHLVGALVTIVALAVAILTAASIKLHGG